MACPFTRPRERDSLSRQQSTVEGNWNIEDYFSEAPEDALTLSHLQTAIQLLTTPSVCHETLELLSHPHYPNFPFRTRTSMKL